MTMRYFETCKRHAPKIELLLLIALAVFRLYLTADRDVAAWNAPHDEFWYVHKAYTGVWAGRYSEMSFAHTPVYALWLELLNTYGVPARLGIDLAWIAAVAFLATSIRNFSGSRIASVLVAMFLLMHPYSIYIFDRSLAETLLAVTIATGLAAALELWTARAAGISARRLLVIMLFSAMFALSCNLRKEGISLMAPMLLLAGLTLFFRPVWWKGATRGAACPGNLLFVLPLVAALGFGWSLSALNYARWGTFAPYDLANPGYKDAMAALAAIDTGRTPLQVSITRQMLERAYAVSPTLRQLRPQMDGPVGRQWTDLSTSIGAQGEIGTGWFYWALRDAAGRAGWHASAPLADEKYRAVAQEVRAAFQQGTLKKRNSVLSSFLDPDVGKWLPAIPDSIAKELRLSILPRTSDVVLPDENATPEQFSEYARVVGRRSPYVEPGSPDNAYLADASADQLVWLARVLGLTLVTALLLGTLRALLERRIDQLSIAAWICLAFGGVRIALFALLDASSWNGEQARYMLPLLPFLACAGGLGLAMLLRRRGEAVAHGAAPLPSAAT